MTALLEGAEDAAVVIASTGGVGAAMVRAIEGRGARAVRLARSTAPPIDVTDEASVAAAARSTVETLDGRTLRLVFDASGFLHDDRFSPEKTWRELDPAHMAHAFAVNAMGPALLMKHFLPLLPKDRRSVFATLSAKVGGIADNRLGGWYAYRASKAALNQFVKTASVELARKNKQAICVCLHPGTVDTGLSGPFAKSGLDIKTPEESAAALMDVIDGLSADQTGGFFDYAGRVLPW